MEVFNLDKSKINEILYHMENQNQESCVEVSTGQIFDITEKDINRSDYYPLAKWSPVEGFRVMNDFVFQLKNPILKDELTRVLNSGHGVFRKFKNVLKNYPEVEKVWFSFKKGEMKDHIINWYNQVREYAGLDQLLEDSLDDDEDILGFDFTIVAPQAEDFDFLLNSDKEGVKELYSAYPEDVVNDIYLQKRGDVEREVINDDYIYIAKTPSGESVGVAWATGYTLGRSFDVMEILQLYVIPEFRGLGIGKLLLNTLLKRYKDGQFKELVVSCQNKNSWLIHFLEASDLKIVSQELCFRS